MPSIANIFRSLLLLFNLLGHDLVREAAALLEIVPDLAQFRFHAVSINPVIIRNFEDHCDQRPGVNRSPPFTH